MQDVTLAISDFFYTAVSGCMPNEPRLSRTPGFALPVLRPRSATGCRVPRPE